MLYSFKMAGHRKSHFPCGHCCPIFHVSPPAMHQILKKWGGGEPKKTSSTGAQWKTGCHQRTSTRSIKETPTWVVRIWGGFPYTCIWFYMNLGRPPDKWCPLEEIPMILWPLTPGGVSCSHSTLNGYQVTAFVPFNAELLRKSGQKMFQAWPNALNWSCLASAKKNPSVRSVIHHDSPIEKWSKLLGRKPMGFRIAGHKRL